MIVDSFLVAVEPAPTMTMQQHQDLAAGVAMARGLLQAEPCDCRPYSDPMSDEIGFDPCLRCSLLAHLAWPTPFHGTHKDTP